MCGAVDLDLDLQPTGPAGAERDENDDGRRSTSTIGEADARYEEDLGCRSQVTLLRRNAGLSSDCDWISTILTMFRHCIGS